MLRLLPILGTLPLVSVGGCGSEPPPRRDRAPVDTSAPTTFSGSGTREMLPDRPNLLLVIADDFGIDKFAAAWPNLDSFPRQPTLEALAAESVGFTATWSSPLCSPTRASILTGRYPHQLSLGEAINFAEPHELPIGELTLPEVLGDAGYATGAFGKWHLSSAVSPSGRAHPNLSGFDRYAGGQMNLNEQAYDDFVKTVDGVDSQHTVYATTDAVDDALDWVATAGEPWFVHLAFHAPHTPIHRPPDHLLAEPLDDEATLQEQFDAMVEAMDTELGRLLDGLDPEVRERTLVVFIGDNGTNAWSITPPFSILRDKGTVFEGGIRVPLIISGTGVRPGHTDALVHAGDLFPTLVELAGVDPEGLGGGIRDARSLVPWLVDPDHEDTRTYLHSERFGGFDGPPWVNEQWAVRDRTHKLVFIDHPQLGPLEGLYDMESDPFSEGAPAPQPLGPADQAIRDTLWAAHDAWREATPYEPL